MSNAPPYYGRNVIDINGLTPTDNTIIIGDGSNYVQGTFDSDDFSFSANSVSIKNSGTDHDALLNFVANEHIYWTNASDNFLTTGSVTVSSTSGIDINPGSDVDTDLITVGVTGTPTFSWDESSTAFRFNTGVVAGDGEGDLTHTISGVAIISDTGS